MRYNATTKQCPVSDCVYLKGRVAKTLLDDARRMVLHIQRHDPNFTLRALLEFSLRCGLEALTKQYGDPATAPVRKPNPSSRIKLPER